MKKLALHPCKWFKLEGEQMEKGGVQINKWFKLALHPCKRFFYILDSPPLTCDMYMWLGRENSHFPFSPYTKSRPKRLRYKFWKPLTPTIGTTSIIQSKIHNLSNYALGKLVMKLLNLGFKFIPPCPHLLTNPFSKNIKT